ncbi:hypothetical protein [Streptomyces filamentosus]|uniref:hypothetical protein n=1 Tax=Streptomyces filamentosus TaxID=67294 RepID=UPI0033CDB09D
MGDGVVGAIRGLFRGRGERGSGPGTGHADGRAREDADGLARVDAEITAFGEALAAHPFVPDHDVHEPALLDDYQRALDAYERAKRDFVGDRNLRDAADVLRALDAGRHALACLDAALDGRPRPHRLPLCFFDPRHGRAAEEVRWAPAGGTARTVAVCAADAVRLTEGRPPIESGLREPERPAAPAPRSRTSTPPVPRTPPAPEAYEAWPAHTGERQRREGRGGAEILLHRTGANEPAVLVVHLERPERSWVELDGPPGEGRPRQPLTHASVLTRAVVPVPADGQPGVRLRMHTGKRWRAWLHPIDALPSLDPLFLDDGLSSAGSYVLRHPGGRERFRVTQHSGSAFALHLLRPDFRPGEALCEGEDAFTRTVVTPRKPGLLYVRSRGTWTLTPAGGPGKRARG